MKREDLLDTAKKTVVGERQDAYGSPEQSFKKIAKLWEVVLGHAVTPQQVALCMIELKVARLIGDINHKDSVVDIAGYAACYAEMLAEPQKLLEFFPIELME